MCVPSNMKQDHRLNHVSHSISSSALSITIVSVAAASAPHSTTKCTYSERQAQAYELDAKC